jgi:hypothetical protein
VPQSALDQLAARSFGNESADGKRNVKRSHTPVQKSENNDAETKTYRGASGPARAEIYLDTDSDSEIDSDEIKLKPDGNGERRSDTINLDTESETADSEIEVGIEKPATLKRTFSGAFNNDSEAEANGGSPAKQQSPRKSPAKKAVAEALTTPLVQKLAGRIFVKPLTGVGPKGERIEGERAVRDHEIAMSSMRESANEFLLRSLLRAEQEPKQEYRVGDCVVVKGKYPNPFRAL